MLKADLTIHDYLRILRKRKYIILLTVVCVAAFSYLFSMFKPVIYRSHVDVAFNYNKTIATMVNDMTFNMPLNLSTMAQMIKRTSVLERAAERVGMIRVDDLTSVRDRIIREISAMISTSINNATEIITITVSNGDPDRCAELANQVADAFREDVKIRNSEEITRAREFIEMQLHEAQSKLDEIESEIEHYRREFAVVDVSIELSSMLNMQNQMRSKLTEMQAERETAKRHLQNLVSGQRKVQKSDLIELKLELNDLKQKLQAEELKLAENESLYKDRHPEIRFSRLRINALQQQMRNYLEESQGEAEAQYQVQIESYLAREHAYQKIIEITEEKLRNFPLMKATISRLEQKTKIYHDMIRSYNKKIEELGVMEAERKSSVPDVINRAARPETPVTANQIMLVLIGGFSGLIIGLFLAFVVETLDVSVSTVEDVEDYLQVPVLGILPFVTTVDPISADDKQDEQQPPGSLSWRCVSFYRPQAILSEAMRIVRTNLKFRQGMESRSEILVTSSLSGEGKTFVSANLAITYAQLGARVLLMDLNLRDPELHDYFGVSKNPGVTDILIGDFSLDEALRSTPVSGMTLLTAGPIPPNPTELLESDLFRNLMQKLHERFDIIVADSPPFLPVADSSVLSRQFFTTIFVHNAIRTSMNMLQRSKLTVESMGGRMDGIILNQLKSTLFMDTDAQINYYYRKKN